MRKKTITEENIPSVIVSKTPWRIAKVKPLEHYGLEVTFNDGTHGFVKMESLILSKKAGVFKKLKDQSIFNQVYLAYGVTTWPDEIDLSPDAMYDEIKQKGTWVVE